MRKYICLIKTEHGFSRHQFAKPCHNAKLIVYQFVIRFSYGPHSYIRLAAVISYYFTQIVNVMGIETEDLSLYDLNMAARKS